MSSDRHADKASKTLSSNFLLTLGVLSGREMDQLNIRFLEVEDWPAVKRIYRQGVDTGIATLETDVPDWEQWDEAHLDHSRLVAEQKDTILGWAALSAVSNRCVYGGVAEVSIYVAESARGEGIGTSLLEALVDHSEENGIWTLQAGIFAENEISIDLHKKCGFRVVGRREKLGCLHGQWKDIMLMERRSDKIGH